MFRLGVKRPLRAADHPRKWRMDGAKPPSVITLFNLVHSRENFTVVACCSVKCKLRVSSEIHLLTVAVNSYNAGSLLSIFSASPTLTVIAVAAPPRCVCLRVWICLPVLTLVMRLLDMIHIRGTLTLSASSKYGHVQFKVRSGQSRSHSAQGMVSSKYGHS